MRTARRRKSAKRKPPWITCTTRQPDWKLIRRIVRRQNAEGRGFAVGRVRSTGSLQTVRLTGLTEEEAEFVAAGTDLEVIPPERFHWKEIEWKHHGATNRLVRKLMCFRNPILAKYF